SSSRRPHTGFSRDWSSDVCSSDLDDALTSFDSIRGHMNVNTPAKNSRIPGLHKDDIATRLARVAAFADLDAATVSHLADMGNLDPQLADRLIENVVATMNIPIGIATNMKVDGEDVLIPMATEESSVVAA